jgi:DNA polymerase-1
MASLLVVDFLNVAYRAYHGGLHAHGPATVDFPEGEPIWVTSGILRLVHDLARMYGVSHVSFALDADGPTFRDALFPAYKAARPGRPPELDLQLSRAQEAIERLGYAVFAASGFEADDVIATLARQSRDHFEEVFIVTGDHDMYVLVNERVNVLDISLGLHRLERVTPDFILARYGLPPRRLVELKALIGDSSDGYPGVAGLHESDARHLLAAYPSLAALLVRLPELARENAAARRILGDLSGVELRFSLAALHDDLPINLDPQAGALERRPSDATINYLTHIGLGSLVRGLPHCAQAAG